MASPFDGVFIHESAYVDEPCTIGAGTKIWHFCHVLPHTVIGKNCILGQNVMVGPEGRIGDNCKIQNNVSLYKGIELEDGPTAPAKVEVLQYTPRNTTLVRITIHEGRKRLVKRMCAAVGHPVRDLYRVSFGGLSAEDLQPGEWRYLNRDEVNKLRELTET